MDAGISFSRSFHEWEAAKAAGLDLWKWNSGEYPRWFKLKVLAWYNLHNLVELHQNDALQRKMERDSKLRR